MEDRELNNKYKKKFSSVLSTIGIIILSVIFAVITMVVIQI